MRPLPLLLLWVVPLLACHQPATVLPAEVPEPPSTTVPAAPPPTEAAAPEAAAGAEPAPTGTPDPADPLVPEAPTRPAPEVSAPAGGQAAAAWSALDCEGRQARVHAAIARIPTDCESDQDCTSVAFGCPFGCAEYVSMTGRGSAEYQTAARLSERYGEGCARCAYRCAKSEPVCVKGRCLSARATGEVAPPPARPPVLAENACQAHSDCSVYYRRYACWPTDPVAVNKASWRVLARQQPPVREPCGLGGPGALKRLEWEKRRYSARCVSQRCELEDRGPYRRRGPGSGPLDEPGHDLP